MTTREQAMDALLALLSTAGTFSAIGRRNRDPQGIAAVGAPALILVEHSESYRVQSTIVPPIRYLLVRAIIYSDVGNDDNAIPASAINNLLDAIDVKLLPDSPMGKCTLGGLVQSVVIDGEVIKAPGDITGKSLAILPIKILLP